MDTCCEESPLLSMYLGTTKKQGEVVRPLLGFMTTDKCDSELDFPAQESKNSNLQRIVCSLHTHAIRRHGSTVRSAATLPATPGSEPLLNHFAPHGTPRTHGAFRCLRGGGCLRPGTIIVRPVRGRPHVSDGARV